jgi:hypothetical protein
MFSILYLMKCIKVNALIFKGTKSITRRVHFLSIQILDIFPFVSPIYTYIFGFKPYCIVCPRNEPL